MTSSASPPPPPLDPYIKDIPNNKALNISSNTSGSSTASSVLIRSTNPPAHQAVSLPGTCSSDRSSSSSSFSSQGSQRVRIKAKYLREVKSPFEEDQVIKTKDGFVPPALPGNLPPDYDQRRETADAVRERSHPLSRLSHGKADQRMNIGRSRISDGGTAYNDDASHGSINGGVILNMKPLSTSSLLKQGAPTSSHTIHSRPLGPSNDVRITQFAAGGKQKVFKEHLLKRQESSGPIKRYIRPTMVDDNPAVSQPSPQDPERKLAQDISNPNAMAAVTAAAVAATIPIVKAQTDLEFKMDAMMERLAHLHELTNKAQQSPNLQQQQQPVTATVQLSDQTSDLQRKLDDVVNKRLLQLEKIQERQLEWQERLLTANQHPAQRLERHSSLTQPNHLGKPPFNLTQNKTMTNGVRTGMTDPSVPGKEYAQQSHVLSRQYAGQPSVPEDKQSYDRGGSRISHSALLQRSEQPEDVQPSKDNDHVGVDSHQATELKAVKQRRYTPAVSLHRYPPRNDSQPKQNPRTDGVLLSDNDAKRGFGKPTQQPSQLDTPAPRRHAPQPLTQNPPPKMTSAGRGLLEEILTSHDEEERRMATRGRQIHTPPAAAIREVASPQSGAEKKAAGLVQQLSKLKREMGEMKTDLIQNLHSGATDVMVEQNPRVLPSSKRHSELHEEAEREWDKLMQRRLQPAPVDVYLRKPPSVPVSFPPTSNPKQPLSPSQYNAPVHSSLCAEAKAVLDKVQSSRACLEANLEAVIRAKEQEEFYNYLDSLYLEGEAAEKAQLRYKVGRMIAALDEDIKHEVNKPKKPHPSVHIPEKDMTVSTTRPIKAGGKKRSVSARIDSGLRKGQPPTVGEKAVAGKKHNKENATQTKKLQVSQAKKQPPVDHNQDEAYLTRVYGKALYQARRSTMQKEPYLKYATSSPLPKLARTPSATPVKGTEMKSAKIQTEPSSRTIQIPRPANQFFFDPYPITTASSMHPQTEPSPSCLSTAHQPAPLTAPSHGRLIPMAVPLGPPQVGGLTQPVTIRTDGLEKGVVKHLERSEIRSNVAVVSVHSERKPQLTVQHLPAVDIDTEPPSAASSSTEHDDPHERGTQEDGRTEITPPDDEMLPGQSDPQQFSHYLAVADKVESKEESEDELPVAGISLPGHYTEMRRSYHGPPFPPRAPPSDPSRAGPSSEKLAGDIRNDIMENTAMEWIEQELMARMISELYSRQPVVEPRPISPDPSIASSANDSIVETIGPAGLQLFVDVGQAVDHTLVSALVREVLEEKVATALGQHDRDIPRRQPTPTPQDIAATVSNSPIPTPEMTPKASPVHTPSRVASRVTTPLASPSEASPVESETESVKELAVTQNTTTGDEPIAAPPSPVTTPINTPLPSPPPDITTPVLSPRESPKLISVIDGSVLTPVRTPEPASPEPEVEDSVELSPSPEPIAVEEEPIPSMPTRSLPTPSTPTPSPSSITTTQPTPSTETAGQTISEGEWLISVKSEGQVDDSAENEPGAVAIHGVSTSSSIDSTLMGAEDIEKDMQDDELSEGEISLPKHTPRLHSHDPVVALLAHMRQRPDPSAAPAGIPPYHALSQTLNDTESLGEVSVGQCPALTPSSERLLFKEAYGAKPPEMTPRPDVIRRSPGEVGSEEQLGTGRQMVEDSTLRVSQLDGTKREESTHKLESITTGQGTAHAMLHPDPRIIQVVGKSSSPEPPRKEVALQQREKDLRDLESRKEQDEIGRHIDDEDDDVDVSQAGNGQRFASRAPIPSNLFGMQTMSDLGTRTLTPDALNLEALLQSGYLSQTFSQSEAGTSDFESTRPTLGHTGDWAGASGTPLRATQTFTEDSLEMPEPGDSGAKAARAMSFSVTLPSAVESHGMDLSQTISEGEIPATDTTSDVSELSGGPL